MSKWIARWIAEMHRHHIISLAESAQMITHFNPRVWFNRN